MFKAKSITETVAARRPLAWGAIAALAAVVAGVQTSSSWSQDRPRIMPAVPVGAGPALGAAAGAAVASPGAGAGAARGAADRLAALDTLQAELELARLRRDLAKVQAEERDAKTGLGALAAGGTAGTANLATPPLPAQNLLAGLPALPPFDPGGRAGGAAPAVTAPAQPLVLLEAWGAGAERQARIRTETGERIVRPGDTVAGLRIVDISGGQVTVRDRKGRVRPIN